MIVLVPKTLEKILKIILIILSLDLAQLTIGSAPLTQVFIILTFKLEFPRLA